MRPIVEVRWLDASTSAEWLCEAQAAAHELAECVSVGYPVYQDKERLVIADSFNKRTGEYGGVTTIPAPCVASVRRLRRGKT